ncbi:MAG: peptidylprolyl isomerase [Opitutia bacterium]|nr:MAG: peptidylprolyl isomerase [Opitutae bacterium]
MRVAKETVVAIEYTLKDDQGNIIDASGDRGPMEYLHGAQNIIPGLEQGVDGLVAGDTKSVLVPPQLGYGEYSEKLLQLVPLNAFGANTPQIGMRFHAETNLGMRVLTIKKIEAEEVTLDGNHELAGKTLHFDIKVVSVRAAELTELAHGHPHQSGGCCGGGGCGSGESSSEGGCGSTGEASEGGCCSSEEGAASSGCCSTEQPVAQKQGGCGSGGCGCSA